MPSWATCSTSATNSAALFDEQIYHREIARRCGGTIEVPIEVSALGHRKRYFIDLLVADGAIFELKTVDAITPRHRGQLLQYLMLTDLPRGKLVNLRPQRIEHEFVNSNVPRSDRVAFVLDERAWIDIGSRQLRNGVSELLRDLGTGLEIGLYEEFVTEFMGGEETVHGRTEIFSHAGTINGHPVRLAGPELSFKFTAVKEADLSYAEADLRRFLNHVALRGIQWINVRHHLVTLKTLLK